MYDSKRIHAIALIANDLKQMREFYVDKLGFSVVKEVPEDGFIQMQLGSQFIELYSREAACDLLGQENVSQDSGKGKIIFSFNKSDSMDEDYKKLKSAGVKFIKEPEDHSWGERTAYFKDPEGNIWELQRWITAFKSK